MDANQWIKHLGLVRHPEGGYYRETYRSAEITKRKSLPSRFEGDRAFATVIHFLLSGNEVSRLHRIKSDETWYYHLGAPLELHVILPTGMHETHLLGTQGSKGEVLQWTVPAGSWFGARVKDNESFTLLSCSVAPGFEFEDFELGKRRELMKQHPHLAAWIKALA